MNYTLFHRGPDDEGYYIDNDLGMAMRRLSIIDIGGGKQPIHNENKTVWIVFNGEIFNYAQLKSSMIKKGHRFYTNSDTETIIHLYEEYGDNCVNHLRGMFAFAIWDSNKRSLLLARDRIGIKPLFVSDMNGDIIFSSEPKAILASEDFPRETDIQAIDAYLAYGYIPAPLSIYKHIRKLLPGHLMRITENGSSTHKYWDLYFRPDYGKTESYFRERFEEIFSESVEMRLMSEVPLGVFLSGGIDSGLITAYAANAMNKSLNTFSIGFSGNTGGYLDERPFARMVAARYKCKHKELEVKPQVNEILSDIAQSFDEPFADDSVIPSYLICKESKKHVTVALTGLGGDELFAGYERHLGFRLSLLFEHFPAFLSKRVMVPMVNRLQELNNGHYTINHLKRFVRAAHMPLPERYASYLTVMAPSERHNLYHPDIRDCVDFRATQHLMLNYFDSDNALGPMDRIFFQDIKTYLPDDILALTDRIGMMHSMELRVPFTDHVLMELCATIPAAIKMKYLQKKSMLKRIAKSRLPAPVLSHRKQGFASPMAQWLKSDLRDISKDLLSKERILSGGIFNYDFINRMFEQHINRKELRDKAIFTLIMFQKWQELENQRFYIRKTA